MELYISVGNAALLCSSCSLVVTSGYSLKHPSLYRNNKGSNWTWDHQTWVKPPSKSWTETSLHLGATYICRDKFCVTIKWTFVEFGAADWSHFTGPCSFSKLNVCQIFYIISCSELSCATIDFSIMLYFVEHNFSDSMMTLGIKNKM